VDRTVEAACGVYTLSDCLAEQPHPPGYIAELSADVADAFFAARQAGYFELCGGLWGNAGGAQ
jgi:hypothetical protein